MFTRGDGFNNKLIWKTKRVELWLCRALLFGFDLENPVFSVWVGPFELTWWRS